MTELQNMKDLVSKLSNRPKNNFVYDRTDTMSIVSTQSSIFDLESSMTSCEFEDLKMDSPEMKTYVLPFKTRPLHFKSKKPDNWLYSNPQANTILEHSENPIEWMRTVFDDNYVMLASKSNLKQKLSKSQGNLCNIDFDLQEYIETPAPILMSHKSVSDLENIPECPNDDFYDYKTNPVLSKTAPGSTENVDNRSSFQDFIAMAKKQEESLKAEVMRRKLEMSKSANNKTVPSMKYIKNGHLSTMRNRFGFTGEKPFVDSDRSKSVTTRFSKVDIGSAKESFVNIPRTSLQTIDHSKWLHGSTLKEVPVNATRMSLQTLDHRKLLHGNVTKEVPVNIPRTSFQTLDHRKWLQGSATYEVPANVPRVPRRSRYNIVNQSQTRPSVTGNTVKLYHI